MRTSRPSVVVRGSSARACMRAGVLVGVGALILGGACTPCRRIETTPLALTCNAQSTFRGELHFDDADTFRSFLSDRCLPGVDDTAIDELVAAVDLSTDAVFVARGARAGIARCIEERAVGEVAVCADGLRVVFDDTESGAVSCPGDWTVAFTLARDDLRAALQAE